MHFMVLRYALAGMLLIYSFTIQRVVRKWVFEAHVIALHKCHSPQKKKLVFSSFLTFAIFFTTTFDFAISEASNHHV
jgi:hypothetical protein